MKTIHSSQRNGLILSCKKNSLNNLKHIKDRRCFYAFLSFFYLFVKEPMGISGELPELSADNPVPRRSGPQAPLFKNIGKEPYLKNKFWGQNQVREVVKSSLKKKTL